MKRITCVLASVGMLIATRSGMADQPPNLSPPVNEQQLPREMHSKMDQRPTITVGHRDATLIGTDNRCLQAAVDYIAALGGGTVEIGPGEYLMNDSLHLRSNVTVRGAAGEGTAGKTVLRKSDAVLSSLALDGDFGEQQITVTDPSGFDVGMGIAVWDDSSGGFHDTVARITGRRGNTFSIDRPLMSDYMAQNGAKAATVFPVISGYHLEGARVENLTVEGNQDANPYLTGCRAGGIFLYRGFGTVIHNCTVRDFHGDGISFQQSNDVTVTDCVTEGNSHLGLHPGSGSQRAIIRHCIARNNGTDGLFLCWRVRHGLFEDNVLEGNGRFGISIGHKDSDNLLQRNHVRRNHSNGVFFRNETEGMAAHRNRLVNNVIEDNGTDAGTAGIRIRGTTNDLVFQNNIIRDTREDDQRTQTTGILVEQHVTNLTLTDNQIDAQDSVVDRRAKTRSPANASQD